MSNCAPYRCIDSTFWHSTSYIVLPQHPHNFSDILECYNNTQILTVQLIQVRKYLQQLLITFTTWLPWLARLLCLSKGVCPLLRSLAELKHATMDKLEICINAQSASLQCLYRHPYEDPPSPVATTHRYNTRQARDTSTTTPPPTGSDDSPFTSVLIRYIPTDKNTITQSSPQFQGTQLYTYAPHIAMYIQQHY